MRATLCTLSIALGLVGTTAAMAADGCVPEAYMDARIAVAPGGNWAIPVTIKGKPKYFAVSAAAITSTVSEEIVTEFGLTRGVAGYDLIDETGRVYRPAQVRVPELLIGKLSGASLPFLVRDVGADGMIAPDIINQFDIELDYSARIFRILKPKRCREAVVHWPNDKIITLPLRIATVSKHAYVPVRVDGVRLDAMLSLAQVDTAVNADIARARLKVNFNDPNLKEIGELQGPSYSKKIYEYTFKTIAFDDYEIPQPTMALMPDMVDRKISNQPFAGNLIRREEEEKREDVTLGMSVLQHFHIYIAYSERRMYLTKSAAAPQ